MAIDTTRFLRGLKRRITVPANQQLIDDSGMLEMADDVITDELVPVVLSVRQNFFVVSDTTPIVADQAEYDIPYRAIGRALRDLKYSSDGTSTGIGDLNLIDLEDAHLFAASGQPTGFYFKADKIVLIPTPVDASQYLERWYNLQPGKLCKTTSAALVTSVSVGATDTVITVSAVPTTMTTGVVCDFVQGKSGASTLGMDKTLTNVSGTQLTFAAADVPATITAGDWVSLAGYSPVIQLPDDCVPMLESMTASRILGDALGDMDGAARLDQKAAKQAMNLKIVLEPRVQGESKKIVNRHGLLRGRGLSLRGKGLYG